MSSDNCIPFPSYQRSENLANYFITFLLVLFSAVASFQLQAQTPAPNLPLPPCVISDDGTPTGACYPQRNDDAGYNLEVEGRLSGEGSSVFLTAKSAIPPCVKLEGTQASPSWSPSPCYTNVSFGSGLVTQNAQCAYIDLRDNQFKYGSCIQLLYKDWGSHSYTMAELTGQSSSGRCGQGADFYNDDGIFVKDPDTGFRGELWSAVGPRILAGCTVTFLDSRPDGLYGPTWAIASFIVDEQVTPFRNITGRPGASVYVPIDGDLRKIDAEVDVAILDAEATITESNWDEGRLFATYTVSVTNTGDEEAENVTLIASFPTDLTIVQSVSDTVNCVLPGDLIAPQDNSRFKIGGQATCKWNKLASGAINRVEFRVRIINATDLDALQSGITLKKFDQSSGTVPQGVLFRVSAADDVDSSNGEKVVKVDIPFRTGSYQQTEMAMLALAPYFDYYTDNLFEQCNVYMDDIFKRLESTRLSIPEVFNELSYGNITSGQYAISGTFGQLESNGHVGVVVYPKGTNYRKTGIIINGTPTQSPLNFSSKLGPDDTSNSVFITSSTSLGGFYYRTRTEDFPGFPQYESNKGFEGEYSNNGVEFTYGGVFPEPIAPDPNPAQCALPPDAVTVVTESPVDLLITDSAGNVVRTSSDEIVEQSLGMGIHSMAFEHDDGSYGWVIVLPKDNYKVQLTGYATGPYTLTMTTYNDQGEPEETVIHGYTEAGQVETFELKGATLEPPPEPTPEPTLEPSSVSGSGGGGGGSIGMPTLIALIMLSLWLRRR